MAAIEKIFSMFGVETGEAEDEIIEEVEEQQPEASSKKGEKVVKFTSDMKTKKVARPQVVKAMISEIDYMILKLTKFPEEAIKIADEIKSGKVLTLNLTGLDIDVARRMLDFIEGAAHITEAKVSKITDDVFSITPKSVKLTSEIPKELESPEIRNYNPMRNDYKYNEEEEIIIKK